MSRYLIYPNEPIEFEEGQEPTFGIRGIEMDEINGSVVFQKINYKVDRMVYQNITPVICIIDRKSYMDLRQFVNSDRYFGTTETHQPDESFKLQTPAGPIPFIILPQDIKKIQLIPSTTDSLYRYNR